MLNMILAFVFGSGLVAILSGLVLFRIPNIIQDYVQSRMNRKLDTLRLEGEKQLQNDLEEIKLKNSKELTEVHSRFQKQYQELEHTFNVKLETLKKRYDVLPAVYEKVLIAQDFALHNYNAKKMMKSDFKDFADLKNFVTFNRFYMDKDVFELAKKCENNIHRVMTSKYETLNADPETVDAKISNSTKIENELEINVQELEQLIDFKMNA